LYDVYQLILQLHLEQTLLVNYIHCLKYDAYYMYIDLW
jgi:hypothetical protein